MRPEPNIPLFLWVATAIVAHAVGGGGATEVVERLEETLDIKSFATDVRRAAKNQVGPVEVSLYSEEEDAAPDLVQEQLPPAENPEDAEEAEEDPDATSPQSDTDTKKPDDTVQEDEKSVEDPEEVKKTPQEEKKTETPPPPPKAIVKPEAPSLEIAKKKPPAPKRSIAVDQHVEDENQKDNPDANFAGEHANHVDEETRARITSTDGAATPPKLGGPLGGAGEEPGNSERTKVAQADDSEGRKDEVPSERPTPAPVTPKAQQAASQPPPAGAKNAQAAAPVRAGQKAQEARAAVEAKDGMQETLATRNGTFSIPKAQEARAAQAARKAQRARTGRRALRATQKGPSLGLGSEKRTANGVNLNLSHRSAKAIVNPSRLAELKKENGERRRSEHRGKWATVGLEKWKPALENYVASVKVGNQTALNAARVPFKLYLNKIHNRLHSIFAHSFLGHLDQLPQNHPLNNMDMSTHLEIALSAEDGRIVRMGITKSSGVTAFDVGALESVEKASPYGTPPGAIVSPDGNVYLHWEFHRKPAYACSTWFARPYIINDGQKSAPPRVAPPSRPPNEREKKKREERRGALERPQRVSPNSRKRSG